MDSYELVDMVDVPDRRMDGRNAWKQILNGLPEGKAGMMKYNNRQRAHQVRQLVAHSAKYHNVEIATRIIHADPEIHGTEGWLLYFWRRGNNGS